MNLRYYNYTYTSGLDTSISNTIDSVDSTTYSSIISSTTVKANRVGLRDSCVSVADEAFGHVSGVKTKLGNLRTGLTNFYGEVDETGLAIHKTALALKSVLLSINTSLSNLNDLLSGNGSYSGTAVTAASVIEACGPLTDGMETLTDYYASTFTNPDGSLNMDAVEAFCDEYDIKINDGTALNPENVYIIEGFTQAVADKLDNCSEEEFNQVVNDLMGVFYVQDNTTLSTWESSDRVNYEYSSEVNDSVETVWFNYSFRPSASLFSACYQSRIQNQVDNVGLEAYNESNFNSLRFRDVLVVIDQNFRYVSYPVEVDDEYQEYRESHYDRSGMDPYDTRPLSEINTAEDTKYVDMPFPGFTFSTYTDETSTPGYPVTYTRMTWNGFGDTEDHLAGFNTLSYNGEYYDISGGGHSVDICSCNTNMTGVVFNQMVDNANAYAESNKVSTGEAVGMAFYDWGVGKFFDLMGLGEVPGFDLVWGIAENLDSANYANQSAAQYQAGLSRDVSTYQYYTNLGGVTGSYYIVNNQFISDDEQRSYVPITITYSPATTQLNLGYYSITSSENPDGHLVVYGTDEGTRVLENRDLITEGIGYEEYKREYYMYLERNGLDWSTMSQSEITDSIRAFNETYN